MMNQSPSTTLEQASSTNVGRLRAQSEVGDNAISRSYLFVRHGESTSNFERKIAGQSDVQLTDLGIRQAILVGKNLKSSGQKIDHIVSSTLSRAKDTATRIASAIGFPESDIDYTDLAKERYLGKLQGQPVERQRDTTDVNVFSDAGAESEQALMHRADELITLLETYRGTTLVVAHNQLLRAVLAIETGMPRSTIASLPNAQVFSTSYDAPQNGGVVLTAFEPSNDSPN